MSHPWGFRSFRTFPVFPWWPVGGHHPLARVSGEYPEHTCSIAGTFTPRSLVRQAGSGPRQGPHRAPLHHRVGPARQTCPRRAVDCRSTPASQLSAPEGLEAGLRLGHLSVL
jgi:hypothetical protein